MLADYQAAVEAAHAASAQNRRGQAPEAAQSALYLLPLATRVRCLFKMDFAEAQYISELRSGPAGHFSYRRVAWEMYLALERQHPALAKHIRVTDFSSRSICCSGSGPQRDRIGRTFSVEFPANFLWKTANLGGGVGYPSAS